MKTFIALVATLFIGFGTATTAGEPPTFHGIKLGISLDSQFQKCPWNPPKEGDIPQYISSPYKDDKGRTIPCFHYWGSFTPAAYPHVETVELIEGITLLKDDKGEVLPRQRLPGVPVVFVQVLVPGSAQLGDGTVEEVMLGYMPLEADRIKDALTKKYGTSHPPDNKVDPKLDEYVFGSKASREVWKTDWGELFLAVTSSDVSVTARTFKLISFERENKKDEF